MNISDALAKRSRDDFFPKTALTPDKIVGLDSMMPDAIQMKYITAPLTKEQIDELIQIPPPKK
ncbi:MAG: hypothetical protein QOF19_2824 [Alphaproteobacteria bacterium]|nr:hypothetical protein [Alphaproteobacteria bacterium]